MLNRSNLSITVEVSHNIVTINYNTMNNKTLQYFLTIHHTIYMVDEEILLYKITLINHDT